MLTAFQDSFRWTNEIVTEVVSGASGRPVPVKQRSYFWQPAIEMRDGRTICALMPFTHN